MERFREQNRRGTRNDHFLWPCSLAVPVLAGWFMVLWFYVQELSKAQPAVVLVLKRLRRRGNSLKSHPTDWEKPVIELNDQSGFLRVTPGKTGFV